MSKGIGRTLLGLGLALGLAGVFFPSCSEGQGGRGRAAAIKAVKWEAMKGSALVVLDIQEAFMPVTRQSEMMGMVQRLVAAAEAAGAPVVWVYTTDSSIRAGDPGFEVARPLAPAPTHLKVVKESRSAFDGTELGKLLDGAGVGRLVFCGLSSDGCVAATVNAAVYEGYRVVVAADAHSVPGGGGEARVADQNKTWRDSKRLEVLPTAKIGFSTAAAGS